MAPNAPRQRPHVDPRAELQRCVPPGARGGGLPLCALHEADVLEGGADGPDGEGAAAVLVRPAPAQGVAQGDAAGPRDRGPGRGVLDPELGGAQDVDELLRGAVPRVPRAHLRLPQRVAGVR